MEGSQYDEEQWSQATWLEAATLQARDAAPTQLITKAVGNVTITRSCLVTYVISDSTKHAGNGNNVHWMLSSCGLKLE